ncbi:MAG: carboxymuconolactone decarboxylase family protein [Saprospiraceae bacterium]|jgi:alkylhydroperoxidase/carboxymuconolactone decarboxylase family protein YurZ|nr:carboxymuconolactone decarboxylase family protein [Saprospiraceae bacterium]
MSTPKDKIPKRFTRFMEKYPQIGQAYSDLGEAVHQAGPLDEKTRALVKVAISGGAKLEGGFHSHVRKAIQAGATKEELQHVALLALPTLGFPSMMALLSWIDDIFKEEE